MSSGERTRYYQVRPRRTPPEFATDELLETCSEFAALLLYRLISLADDQGRMASHPRSVRGTAFPLRQSVTERKVDAALQELVRAGFIIRYDVGGRWFIQIDRWFDMQGKWGQRRTYPSRYPAPPSWDQDIVTAGAQEIDEVRAPGTQSARDVPPPSSPALPFSSSIPVSPPGLEGSQTSSGGPERLEHLLELAKRRVMTDAEAIELGSLIAIDETEAEDARR